MKYIIYNNEKNLSNEIFQKFREFQIAFLKIF
jgi:hypothetical protein